MHATAVEKITPQPNETRNTTGRLFPPAVSHLLRWGILALFALGMLVSVILGLVQKWLWMRQLDYTGIFWTLLSVRWGLFGLAFFISALYLWSNLRIASKNIDVSEGTSFFSKEFTHPADATKTINIDLSPTVLVFAIDAAIVALSLLFAFGVSSQWDTYLRFRYGGTFGIIDPLFGIDLGFYVFRLPFYEMAQGSITVLTIGALAILTFCSVFGIRQSKATGKLTVASGIVRHFIVLLIILAANFGWGFVPDHYELVYSTLGIVHGAGYAAAHFTRVALWMMTGISALAGVLLAAGFARARQAHCRRHCHLRGTLHCRSVGVAALR